MLETSVILRAVLYQIKTAETLEKAIEAIEALCPEDDIAAVEKKIADSKSRKHDKAAV